MALITWLGGEENGNVAVNQWGRFKFVINQPLEVNDPHIIAKASANRFFKVDGGGGKAEAEIVPDDPADDPDLSPEPQPPAQALEVPEATEEIRLTPVERDMILQHKEGESVLQTWAKVTLSDEATRGRLEAFVEPIPDPAPKRRGRPSKAKAA